MLNLRRLFKTVKYFIQTINPSSSIIKTFRLINVDLFLNASVKKSSLNIYLFNFKVLYSCDSKERFITYRFYNRREGLIKVNPSLLFITLYYLSCLILYNPSFTIPLILKNLLGVKNFIIKRLVNKYLGIIYL